MQILTECQKLVSQLPAGEKIMAKRWISRLKTQSSFPREQRIQDRYTQVLWGQMQRLISQSMLTFESPFNVFPLDIPLTDLPEYIMKRFTKKVEVVTKPVVPELKPAPADIYQPISHFTSEAKRIEEELSKIQYIPQYPQNVPQTFNLTEDDIKQIDQLNEDTKKHYSDISSGIQEELQESLLKESTLIKSMLSEAKKSFTGKDPLDELYKSKHSEEFQTVLHIPQLSPQPKSPLLNELKSISQQLQENQAQLDEIDQQIKRNKKITFLENLEDLSSTLSSKGSIPPIQSQFVQDKSKLSQISNSFPVEYENTPAIERSNYQENYQNENKPMEHFFKITEYQGENRQMCEEVKNEIHDKGYVELLDKLAELERRIQQQDDFIFQLGDLMQ
uniref:DUF4485 domain-containing protein n=1 Tax=Trepomonas sp. PC1 TaxID=1076344 RepID=A0A146K6N5_9EUKA|eukprot:JAP92510.1 Hypothetical protein TPC1_15520 [Trepomonas sp. PC1]